MIKIIVESVREPRWANEGKSAINCLIKTNTLTQEVPFTASMSDSEAHGRDIYVRCLKGEFGEIAPFELTIRVEPTAGLSSAELPPEYQELQELMIEVNRETSRGSYRSVVIVWASMVDNVLDRMLEAAVVGSGQEATSREKPPKTFDKRIKAALKRELINEEEAKKCHHIRKIRNQAAHEWRLKLENVDILPSLAALYDADHRDLLVFHKDLDFLLQQVYSSSCAMLVMKFLSRVERNIPKSF